MNNLISPQARLLMSEGRMHHMRFKVSGYGELPEEGYKDEWWTEILKSQESIPPQGKAAMEVVKKTGVPIKGMYLMHEAPKLLAAPKKEEKATEISQAPKINVEAILGFLGMLLTVLGVLFVFAIRLDPILYVVTEDGTHVEVARWSDYITQ